ncbi:MAG: hypothetical protein U9M98_02270 [Patescibacteria group bacterium]|nr:hypothetical protein [Patescibacteria group bacterium]
MSLTKVSKVTRRGIAAFIIFLAVLTIGRIGWNVGVRIYRHFFPPKKPAPETAFGKIGIPKIPSSDINLSKWKYELDTPTARLPAMPDRLPIFPLEKNPTTPLTELQAEDLAKSLGFTSSPKAISPTEYRWEEGKRTLEMNIVSQAFSLTYDSNTLEIQLTKGNAPTKQLAEDTAQNFLNRLSLGNKTLESAKREVSFVQINNGKFSVVESLSQAQLTRVDLFKVLNVDGKSYDVLGPKPRQGLTTLLVAGGSYRSVVDQVPIAEYQNWKIKTEEGSTYPLLTSSKAWENLEAGNAALVYLKPQGAGFYENPSPPLVEKIRIQNMQLAYFESKQAQNYLTPIYVFKGLAEVKNQKPWEIVLYLNAIPQEWVNQEPQESNED